MAKRSTRKERKAKKQSNAPINDTYISDEDFQIGQRLIPALGYAEEALVYAVGAEKHGPDEWREGMKWSVCLSKALRHLGHFLAGESRCPKDGQHHLASVKFYMNALMEYEVTHPELDDITKVN